MFNVAELAFWSSNSKQTIRMIAVSMNSGLGKYEQTMSRMDGFCKQLVEQKAELMLYPELVVLDIVILIPVSCAAT